MNEIFPLYTDAEEWYESLEQRYPGFILEMMEGVRRVQEFEGEIELLTPSVASESSKDIANPYENFRPMSEYCDWTHDPTECGEPSVLIEFVAEDGTLDEAVMCLEVLRTVQLEKLESIYIVPPLYPFTSIEELYATPQTQAVVYELTEDLVRTVPKLFLNSFGRSFFQPLDNDDEYRPEDGVTTRFDSLDANPELKEGHYYIIRNPPLYYLTVIQVESITHTTHPPNLTERTLNREEVLSETACTKELLLEEASVHIL